MKIGSVSLILWPFKVRQNGHIFAYKNMSIFVCQNMLRSLWQKRWDFCVVFV